MEPYTLQRRENLANLLKNNELEMERAKGIEPERNTEYQRFKEGFDRQNR